METLIGLAIIFTNLTAFMMADDMTREKQPKKAWRNYVNEHVIIWTTVVLLGIIAFNL